MPDALPWIALALGGWAVASFVIGRLVGRVLAHGSSADAPFATVDGERFDAAADSPDRLALMAAADLDQALASQMPHFARAARRGGD